MPWSWWLILPLVVWLIYTSDHLLDARRIGPTARTERHHFHYRHFRILSALVLLTALVTAGLIWFFLPRPMLIGGLCLGAAAGLHLVLAQWTGFRLYPAELVIAALYTAGVWFGPWLTGGASTAPELLLAATFYFCSALSNLFVFSLFEREIDARESPNTLVLALGVRASEVVLATICVGSVVFAIFLIRSGMHAGIVALLFAATNLPIVIYALRRRFARDELYRLICDGALILYAAPALLDWFA